MHAWLLLNLPLLLVVGATTSGCDNRVEGKPATQVAAKVNASEITVHQINQVLGRSAGISPEVASKAKQAVLDGLIDQQVAQQQAIARNLHRSPKVMQEIEAVKTEILARAYVEQIAATQPQPTAMEVKKYYTDHPELFAKRQLFTLEEIVVLTPETVSAGLRAQVARTSSMRETVAWLEAKGAKFEQNRGVRAAELIPLAILPQLQAMKKGAIGVVEGGGRLSVFRVVDTQRAPTDEQSAAPRIRQVLFNERIRAAVAKEMSQYKEQSKIEYFGEFGPTMTLAAKPQDGAKGQDSAERAARPDFAKGVRGLR